MLYGSREMEGMSDCCTFNAYKRTKAVVDVDYCAIFEETLLGGVGNICLPSFSLGNLRVCDLSHVSSRKPSCSPSSAASVVIQ